jgi:Mrp family chromosome partitioning ATPase
VKPLTRIRDPSGDDARAGTLRGADLESFATIHDAIGSGSVLVTGVGRGHEAVSVGLACAAAAGGARTALVECDLDSPHLAATLGLTQGPGLHEYLRRGAEAPEILQALVLAGPASRGAGGPLVCIVAGEPAAGGAEALASDEFHHAVAMLRSAYELVVLHGPPLGEEAGALAAAASRADLLLACVEPSMASGRSGRRLARALRALPAPRAEVVVCGDR